MSLSSHKDEAIFLALKTILESQQGIKDTKIINEVSATKMSAATDMLPTPVNSNKMRKKEAIFDLAMSPETELVGKLKQKMPTSQPMATMAVPECWDTKDSHKHQPE